MAVNITNLSKQISAIQDSHTNLITMIETQINQISTLTQQYKDLALRVDSLSEMVEIITSKESATGQKSSSLQQSWGNMHIFIGNNIINVMINKQSRANNILLFNLSLPFTLNCYYQNVRGLRAKLYISKTSLPHFNYDIFIFTDI